MNGRLGKADLAATTDTDIYTVPAGVVASANINVCNRSAANVSVRIAVRSGALANTDYIEYDLVLAPNGTAERTGVVLGAGEVVVVRASAVGVSVRVHGFEESL